MVKSKGIIVRFTGKQHSLWRLDLERAYDKKLCTGDLNVVTAIELNLTARKTMYEHKSETVWCS